MTGESYVQYRHMQAERSSTCIDDTIDIALPRSFSQPDAINAATWYPSASSTTPETFCFVASVRDTPVRLIDATDGRVS